MGNWDSLAMASYRHFIWTPVGFWSKYEINHVFKIPETLSLSISRHQRTDTCTTKVQKHYTTGGIGLGFVCCFEREKNPLKPVLHLFYDRNLHLLKKWIPRYSFRKTTNHYFHSKLLAKYIFFSWMLNGKNLVDAYLWKIEMVRALNVRNKRRTFLV